MEKKLLSRHETYKQRIWRDMRELGELAKNELVNAFEVE
jgi:hypothetical protein